MAWGILPLRFCEYSARKGRLWISATVESVQMQVSCMLGRRMEYLNPSG